MRSKRCLANKDVTCLAVSGNDEHGSGQRGHLLFGGIDHDDLGDRRPRTCLFRVERPHEHILAIRSHGDLRMRTSLSTGSRTGASRARRAATKASQPQRQGRPGQPERGSTGSNNGQLLSGATISDAHEPACTHGSSQLIVVFAQLLRCVCRCYLIIAARADLAHVLREPIRATSCWAQSTALWEFEASSRCERMCVHPNRAAGRAIAALLSSRALTGAQSLLVRHLQLRTD